MVRKDILNGWRFAFAEVKYSCSNETENSRVVKVVHVIQYLLDQSHFNRD